MGNSAGVDEVYGQVNLPEIIRHLNFRPVNETLVQQVRVSKMAPRWIPE